MARWSVTDVFGGKRLTQMRNAVECFQTLVMSNCHCTFEL